jgi:uncharacterized SAM-binding protein YcdF (DUF218 family)
MFVLKQFLKTLILPPGIWLLMLCAVIVFWKRNWARKFLITTVVLIGALHSGLTAKATRYYLESRYAPLTDCRTAGQYDAIVVLTGWLIPASGLIPRPQIDVAMYRRLEEAFRLYRQAPKPIIVSGGHVDPFTPSNNENRIACDYLVRWGVAETDIIQEPASRDTFESAFEVSKILTQRGWTRYLLVTSALHMPRSMLAFEATAPEPVPAPGDFTVERISTSPLSFFPTEGAARDTYSALHEYVGLVNYYWRLQWRRK